MGTLGISIIRIILNINIFLFLFFRVECHGTPLNLEFILPWLQPELTFLLFPLHRLTASLIRKSVLLSSDSAGHIFSNRSVKRMSWGIPGIRTWQEQRYLHIMMFLSTGSMAQVCRPTIFLIHEPATWDSIFLHFRCATFSAHMLSKNSISAFFFLRSLHDSVCVFLVFLPACTSAHAGHVLVLVLSRLSVGIYYETRNCTQTTMDKQIMSGPGPDTK